jgi:hypothetical protein
VTYSERKPGRFLRRYASSFYYAYFQNHDGDWLEMNLRLLTTIQYLNFWSFDLDVESTEERIDDRLTRQPHGTHWRTHPPTRTLTP